MATNEKEWVRARADCTLETIYQQVSARLRRDVERFNRIAARKHMDRRFLVETNTATTIYRAIENRGQNPRGGSLLIAPEQKKDYVKCHLIEDRIVAERPNEWSLDIRSQWNEETLTCDLFIEDQVLSLSRISQRILGDFLFEE